MVNELDFQIERFADLHGKVTCEQVSHEFKIPKREARRRLDGLVRQGYLKPLF